MEVKPTAIPNIITNTNENNNKGRFKIPEMIIRGEIVNNILIDKNKRRLPSNAESNITGLRTL